MYQPHLFETSERVVNVASVPQRSLFRYAGGKTWLVPRIRQWLNPHVRKQAGLHPLCCAEFVEPFAGGGIIGITVAAERLAEHVTFVELDEDVAAVWQTALDPNGSEWLAERILAFDINVRSVNDLLACVPISMAERAFATIVKNRTAHGGILAAGAGLIKHGEGGKGLRSRWYPATLAQRIRNLAQLRDRITFILGDGIKVIEAYAHRTDAFFFIDPPYTVPGKGKRAGKRLYRHCNVDHERLFTLCDSIQGDVLLTYDATSDVCELANQHSLECRLIPMKNTHHAVMNEFLIGPRLAWLDSPFHTSS
jgi:DNA adenine methylase